MHAPKRPKKSPQILLHRNGLICQLCPNVASCFSPSPSFCTKVTKIAGAQKIAPKRTVSGRSKPRYHLNSTQMHDTLVSVTGEPGRPTPFRQAAPGRPSSPASERLAPTAFSLTSAGRLLLPFFAYGCKNYRLCSIVCQAFLSQRTTESAARLPSPTAAGI